MKHIHFIVKPRQRILLFYVFLVYDIYFASYSLHALHVFNSKKNIFAFLTEFKIRKKHVELWKILQVKQAMNPPQTTLFHIPMQSFENRNPFHDIHHILKIQGLVAKHQPLLWFYPKKNAKKVQFFMSFSK